MRLTLYDAANKCFFGSTWLGPYFPSSGKENGRHKIVCNEVCILKKIIHIPGTGITQDKFSNIVFEMVRGMVEIDAGGGSSNNFEVGVRAS